ncbi:hypothetical protein DTO271G3_3195 [Paecilomyces variotii]|nr:hypothetical protein DTO271G3_3195 [Paecilomyces variotii]
MTACILGRITSFILQVRLLIGKKVFGSLGPTIVKISRNRVIKGPCQSAELEALNYVAKYTSIPVPKVYATYDQLEGLYTEMEYIEGTNLETAWTGGVFSPAQKKAIVKELAGFVEQLRRLKPPHEGIVASAELRSVLDYRVGTSLFGPFHNHEEFHSFLRGHIPLESCSQVYGEPVSRCHSRQYRSCFSHSDLVPRNIIVRDGKVVALVDWAFAGWYPEYWEYTKAHYGLLNMPDWYAELRSVVARYDDELAAERALWEQFNEPGMAQQLISNFASSKRV